MSLTRRAPSVKSLMSAFRDITRDDAILIRNIIKATNRIELEDMNPVLFHNLVSPCWNKPELCFLKLLMIDDIIATHGVEYTPRGKNRKSPAITYCNAGYSYASTILFVNGSFRLGCWGDIVERGNYE